jgi:hypothetical protein
MNISLSKLDMVVTAYSSRYEPEVWEDVASRFPEK